MHNINGVKGLVFCAAVDKSSGRTFHRRPRDLPKKMSSALLMIPTLALTLAVVTLLVASTAEGQNYDRRQMTIELLRWRHNFTMYRMNNREEECATVVYY